MPGSLRFRLPALFLLGIVIAGVVAAAIAVQLFQGYTRDPSLRGARARGARHRTALRRRRAARRRGGDTGPDFATEALELATGDQLYYFGAPAFPGQDVRCRASCRVGRAGGGRAPADKQVDVRVQAAGRATDVPRGLAAAAARAGGPSRSARSSSRSRATSSATSGCRSIGAARRGGRDRRRSLRGSSAGGSHGGSPGPSRRSRAPRTRSPRGTTRSRCPVGRGGERGLAPLASGSTRWPRGWRRRRSASASS